jgi:epoxide hydrolase-like predicted phosphatase
MSIIEGNDLSCKKPVIVFDFGGVVGGTEKSVVRQEIKTRLGIQEKKADDLLAQLSLSRRQNITQEEFWSHVEKRTHISLPKKWAEHVEVTRLLAIRTNPKILQIVRSLRKNGYRVFLLSNVTSRRAQFIRSLGVYDLFESVLLSCDLGVAKPDPQIFHILCERLGVDPKNCLLIDNKPETIAAAQKFGLHTILYESTSSTPLDIEIAKKLASLCT